MIQIFNLYLLTITYKDTKYHIKKIQEIEVLIILFQNIVLHYNYLLVFLGHKCCNKQHILQHNYSFANYDVNEFHIHIFIFHSATRTEGCQCCCFHCGCFAGFRLPLPRPCERIRRWVHNFRSIRSILRSCCK